jgi:ferric-dicitrate binding protein FerR (iron transport regulator)
MQTHREYLKTLSLMTDALPTIDPHDLEQTSEHAKAWRSCEDCCREAASDARRAPEESAYSAAHRRAFPIESRHITLSTLAAQPAGSLMLSLCFKSSDQDTKEACALAREVLGIPVP